MSFKVFKRKDSQKRNDLPQVSIRVDTLAFNAAFTNKAQLAKYRKVTILVDEEDYKLGFKFHNQEDDTNSLTLYSDGISKSNRVVSARQLMNDYKWIAAISKFPLILNKRFTADWNNIEQMWIISLCPTFENTISSESELQGVTGIYRYKQGDEIVYIGKGNIRSRINSPERTDWHFETIEYSIIKDVSDQSKWESYWLDRHANQFGQLPFYNKIKASK